MNRPFHETSYELHIRATDKDEVPSIIAEPNLIDALQHRRMYDTIRPLAEAFRDASWLTIGDTGGDAFYLRQIGIEDVTASSISDTGLRNLCERGLLGNIPVKQINAEKINLEDESVDFIFCKESYHHLPRPPLGFYEFLRVCRIATVFIEPAQEDGPRPLSFLKIAIKSALRRKAPIKLHFEPSGNYLYRISEKEFIKQATAVQLPAIAFRYMNDFNLGGLYKRPVKDVMGKTLFWSGIFIQNLMASLRLIGFGLVVCIVFKKDISEKVRDSLEKAGFRYIVLPRNPYL